MSSPPTTRERARVAEPVPPADRPRPSYTSPLRQAGYAAVLTALAFVQGTGLMVADTKFDLLTDPGRFLARGTRLWDPDQAFGQLPDQSYGYAWPMGPFYWVGEALQLPPWVIQRLWWALLLCVAFFGMLRLLGRLGLGTDATRVVAAFAFVLTPRITTLIGVVSVEVWPMALAPWVLLPLVRGTESGSVRRAGALSALAVLCAGGVNAVAVAAVLPLGVVWILTRTRGSRRWRLFGWWTLFTVLATVWWSGPLVLLGRYSPPFLDYIENATITTLPTDLTRTLLGVNDWVAYFGGRDFQAGLHLVGTPYLLADAAFVAALGLAGIGLRGNPHRRFLALGLLTGVALVGFGYARDLSGFFAEDRRATLDLALAPLRNIHKFDVVLRIPLALGLAHALAELPRLLRGVGSVLAVRLFRVATGLAVVALATPWLYTLIPARDGVEAVPDYWQEAADYLADHDDGTVALELPASSFGIYQWGNVHDDVLQGLARSPWAVRSVVPLAQPGNVVFLDAVTRVVESGRPSDTLASYLAANNVGTLVVRNDLDRLLTGAPDPAYVRSVLTASRGLRLVQSFGPATGVPAYQYAEDAKRTRLVTGAGISAVLPSIDVYRVRTPARASLSAPGSVLVGDPSSPTAAGWSADLAGPHLLAEDAEANGFAVSGQVLTDDMRRREMNFPAVRWNESATMTPAEEFRLAGKEQSHRVVTDEDRWDTVATWTAGVDEVTASSSQAYADAVPPLQIGSHPGAALDADLATAWVSAREEGPDGQWWQADLTTPATVGRISVALRADSVPLSSLEISGGGQARVVDPPAPGEAATYAVGLPVTSTLRVTAHYDGPLLSGSVAVSEIGIDDLHPQRLLTLPAPLPDAPVDSVVLSRDPDRLPCAQIADTFACDPILTGPGEDGDTLARAFTVPVPSGYTLTATASLRRVATAWGPLLAGTGVQVRTEPAGTGDVAASVGAIADGDPTTTWVADDDQPEVRVRLPKRTRLRTLELTLAPGAAASAPARVEVTAGQRREVVDLDEAGFGTLPGWRLDRFRLRIDSTYPAFSVQGSRFGEMGPGVTELRLNGAPLTSSVFRTLDVPCGQGPKILLGGRFYDTSLLANVRDLVRGASVPLQVCGVPEARLSGDTTLVVGPTTALRVDSIRLTRDGASSVPATTLDVTRDRDGLPATVDLPARTADRVLSLPQNDNEGWQATLQGERLAPVRVDGWKQGWLVPAGEAGTVRLEFAPRGLFRAVLAVGALLPLVVLLAASPLGLRRRERREPPPLRTGRPGLLDVVAAALVAGWLTGWVGLVLVAGVAVAVRRWGDLPRWGGWGVPAGAALLLAVVALTWEPVKDLSWALTWAQVWAMVAIACVSGALMAGWGAAGRARGPAGPRGSRWARGGGPSAGSST